MKPDIEHLKDFSKKFNRPVVVTLSIYPDGENFHMTTYGATRKLCKLAGALGDEIAQAIHAGAIHAPQLEPKTMGLMSSVKQWVADPADGLLLELRCGCGGQMTVGSWKANGTCDKCIEEAYVSASS